MSEIIASGIIQKKRLQQWIDVYTPLVDEGKLHWSDEGLSTRAIDSATVAAINPALLKPSGWEHYESPGSVTVGVDFNRLEDMIGLAGSNDLIQLGVDMETRTLGIEYENVDHSMSLINPDTVRDEPDRPDIDLPNKVVLTGEQLSNAQSATDMVSDHVRISAHPDTEEVRFSSSGDLDDTIVTFGPEERIDENQLKEVGSIFSIEYIGRVVKPIPNNSEVTLRFGQDLPVILEWSGFDGSLDVWEFLAPRLKTE